jgi:hypothetical protein
MKTLALWAVAPLAAILVAGSARAQQCPTNCRCQNYYQPTFMDVNEAAFRDNNRWPHQYTWPSRRGICQSFAIMANNGWQRQNLLGQYHFDPKTGELSAAGRVKVQWILTQAPPQRRTIYVEQFGEQQLMAARVQSVQTLAANLATGAGPADVQETLLHDDGHPAGSVDAVFTGFSTNQKPPVLPEAESSTSDSGS